MTQYISEYLNISHERANLLRADYWKKYGSTLRGLMIHHKINPNDFLNKTHNLKDIEAKIEPVKYLKTILKAIKDDKIILTNAPIHYTKFILKKLDIHYFFKKTICIEDNFFISKPDIRIFRKIKRMPYQKIILIDDSLENLRSAYQAGLKTIHISNIRINKKYASKKLYGLGELFKLKRF
jgi:putative hydrolase of the HAD superfamily